MNPISNIGLDYNGVFKNGFDIDQVDRSVVQSEFDRGVTEACLIGHTGILYGASTSGELALLLLQWHPDIMVHEAVDLAPAKSEFCGLKVVRPNAAQWGEFVLIAVSPSNYLSVMQTLYGLVPEDIPLCFLWENEFFDPRCFELLEEAVPERESKPVSISSDKDQLDKILHQPGADNRGRIFFLGTQAFRLILKQDIRFYQSLIGDENRMQFLRGAGIVETRQADFGFPDYPLVLEHQRLIPQRPANWSSAMFRDAALFFFKFFRRLIREGFSLQDCHSANVMFEGTRPRFVDFTSIGPREATTFSPPIVKTLFECWIHPLALLKSNQTILLRELLNTGVTFISFPTAQKACPADVCREVQELQGLAATCVTLKRLDEFLDVTIRWGESVNPVHGGLGWNRGGYQDELETVDEPKTVKEKAVDALYERFRPASVLDLGCNKGRYSVMAACRGAQAVAVDMADELLDELYKFAGKEALPILPMVARVDGLEPFRQHNVEFDMTLALALIHHLVFSCHMTVDSVLDLLNEMTKRVLVLEFVAANFREVRLIREGYSPEAYPRYNLPYVISWLEQHFVSVERIPLGETRTILVAVR